MLEKEYTQTIKMGNSPFGNDLIGHTANTTILDSQVILILPWF